MLHTHEVDGSSPLVSTRSPKTLCFRGFLCSGAAACAHAFLWKNEEGRRTSFMGKIRMKKAKNEVVTLREVFREFITSQGAKGVAKQTLKTYHTHFHSVSKHLNMDLSFGELSKRDLENMIVSMRAAGLANNSISSYVRVMKTFLNWCKEEGYTTLTLPNYKQEETIKETYSDEELETLLRRPAADCSFCEFRNCDYQLSFELRLSRRHSSEYSGQRCFSCRQTSDFPSYENPKNTSYPTVFPNGEYSAGVYVCQGRGCVGLSLL